MTTKNAPARWPLALIALPAAVAIWTGWVGLGGMCGFGPVSPLPGITGWTVNTAITLPVGVEAYAAFALGAWMRPGTPDRARKFARRSALGALAYGMAGQVIYHLLAAAGRTRAPWPVVVVVSCMPVAVLGLAAALTHLLGTPGAGVPARLPGIRELKGALRVGQPVAERVQAYLAARDCAPAGSAPSPAGVNGRGRQ